MEIKVDEIQSLAPIRFNYEDLKKELLEKTEHYKTAVYTEDSISCAKQDRANLNKLAKAINDEKIRVKNQVLQRYLPFENQCKELMEIVNDASKNIDEQIKNFEQGKKDEKLQLIVKYFMEHIGLYEGLIDFDIIFNERWLNATYDINTIYKEIDHIFGKTKNDIMTINSMVVNEETNKQVADFYFKHIAESDCLGKALNEAKRIEASKARIDELKKQEEEKKLVKQTIIPQEENKTSEKLYELNFKVYVTKEQTFKLKEFFVSNNIKYEKI